MTGRESSRPRLRIGLLLDDMSTPQWAHRMIEIIVASGSSEIVVAVVGGGVAIAGKSKRRWFTRLCREPRAALRGAVRRGLALAYRKLFERHLKSPAAEARVSLVDLLRNVPVLDVQPVRSQWSDSLTEADLQSIARFNVDVLIRLGFRILRGGILSSARYGLWSYHHGDNRVNRGGPPGFWEAMEEWPTTGSVLQILTEDLDNGAVLYRSFSCTDTTSVLDNQRNNFRNTLSFIPRKLQELHRSGPERFFDQLQRENCEPFLYSRRLYTTPSNAEYAQLLVRKTLAKVRVMYRNRFFLDQWILLFDLKTELSSSLWRYQRMIPPPDRFWADPCPVETAHGYAIFIEEFPFEMARGRIAVIEMDRTGRWTAPVTVLERPYHLSYPFVFTHEGQHYMLPESAQNDTIELYRCVEFPHRWELQEILMSGIKAYDSTIVRHDGRYWLFANVVENAGASSWDELFVFWSDQPFGAPWTPHPQNPVVSDCRSARPAGRMFESGGKLYRPSQNCSHRYGWGFNIARVDRLDDTGYSETIVSQIEPDWAADVVATHTFNRAGALHVIDAQIRRRR